MISDTVPSARGMRDGYAVAHERRGAGVVMTKADGMSVESGGSEGEGRPSCTSMRLGKGRTRNTITRSRGLSAHDAVILTVDG
jgi:hypothetical protein